MTLKLAERLKDQNFRFTFFEQNFFEFCEFYFREYYSFDTPAVLMKYYSALEQGKNVYFKGFRGSAKTTIAQMFVAWNIAYKKRRNIMRYSQTIDNAEENLTYIANAFIGDTDGGERFIRDFGNLYYADQPERNGQKRIKRIDKFVTENECYVRAMSLGTSPRGKNFTASDGKFRPDLLIFDDVDTINSCASKKKIDKNFEFMLNEVIGGTTGATQMLFLGNTIYEDGLVPRFEEHIKNDPMRETIVLPIYDDKRQIVRDRFVETDEEANKKNKTIFDIHSRYTSLETEKRRLGTISFNQNYLLIPFVRGEHIITREMIQFTSCENVKYEKIQIGIDPAISEKEGTDRFGISVVGFIGKRKYVIECFGLEGSEKSIGKAVETIRRLYEKYSRFKSIRLVVETVAYQAVLKTIFRQMGFAVVEQKTTRDKTTRLMEKQIEFEQGNIYFNPETTTELVDELLMFPNGEHDDLVDAMLFGITENKKSFFISSL